jgi:transcriptional regulator with XRE-family HTH domain
MANPLPHQLLVEAMVARGITQAELSRRTGASTGTVANWCEGRRGVGPEYADKLREELGLDPKIWWRSHRKPKRTPASRRSRKASPAPTGQVAA